MFDTKLQSSVRKGDDWKNEKHERGIHFSILQSIANVTWYNFPIVTLGQMKLSLHINHFLSLDDAYITWQNI